MKPFLGINVTEDKKNTKPNGMEMMVEEPSQELAASLESSKSKMDETEKKAKLPLALRIIQFVSMLGAAIFVIGILRGLDDITLTEAYANAPVLFWIGGACIVLSAGLSLLEKNRKKNVLESDDSIRTLSNISASVETIFADLGVPDNARDVDIFVFQYKDKNGETKIVAGNRPFMFMNFSFKIFADSRKFYLANIEGKYEFCRDDIKGIRTVGKRYSMNDWNKEYPYDDERYKKYKLTLDRYGVIYGKNYHILEVESNGQLWGIYFPSYELPLFEALSGMKADEAK
ncbi:MAG: hypothetical protein IIX69_03665 [Clostridia bacterium]|nr:hypothetical protein [Clostridia bacterium]MBQ1934328.1 hypothetical protein [Clostridia bacterium]